MHIAIRTILILSSIALFLPVFSGYVMAFTMLVCQFLPAWRRCAVQSDQKTSPAAAFVWSWRTPILVLLGSYALATICAALRDGGGNWHGVQQFLGNSTVKYGLLWFFAANFMVLAVRKFQGAEFIAKCIPWIAGVHLLYCLGQRYLGIDWVHGLHAVLPPNRFAYGVYRVSGFSSHPLTIGYQLCFIMAACGAIAASQRMSQPLRHRALLAAIFAWVTILISGSRGPLLVSVALIAWLMFPFIRKRAKFMIAAAVASLLVIGLISLIPGTIDRFFEAFTKTSGDTRQMDLHVYAAAFADHPLVGLGHLNFRTAISAYYKQFGGDDNIALAHNTYLQVATESGLIGLLGFLQWIAAWAIFARKLPNAAERRSFCGLVVVMVLSGVTQNSLQDSGVILTLTFVSMILGALFSETSQIREMHDSSGSKYQNSESRAST